MSLGEAQEELSPSRVLRDCLHRGVPEAHALPRLLHMLGSNPSGVLEALLERAGATVANADSGVAAAQRAGRVLVSAARFLDAGAAHEGGSWPGEAEAPPGVKAEGPEPAAEHPGAPSGRDERRPPGVCRALLEHVVLLAGGSSGRAAKDRSVRAAACGLLAALAPLAGPSAGAQAKLLELAADKVPGIRERAVRGLATFAGAPAVEEALLRRLADPWRAVRASAVRAVRVSRATARPLVGRVDDTAACVRVQLFCALAGQPASAEVIDSAALTRALAGLDDSSAEVRRAAGAACDAWCARLGGTAALLARCDLVGDEALGEAVAAALVARWPAEGRASAQALLGGVGDREVLGSPAELLLARVAAGRMAPLEDSVEAIDVPGLVAHAREALRRARSAPGDCRTGGPSGFCLRQLLCVLVMVDVSVCDEAARAQLGELALGVLSEAPVGGIAGAAGLRAHSAVDLGVVLLRRCCGLARCPLRSGRTQALEAACSARAVSLLSDLWEPGAGSAAGADEGGEGGHVALRLSLRIQDLSSEVSELDRLLASLRAQKAGAVAAEDFLEAHRLKEAIRAAGAEVSRLRRERDALLAERDGVCLRVLAVLNAMLRWTSSDLCKDPALLGALDQMLVPIMSLPALSDEVELAAISAVGLFSEHDGALARRFWGLLLELVRGLSPRPGARQPGSHVRARAALAAKVLADCARLHGREGGRLDREAVLCAARALSAVAPFGRWAVAEPLCGWLLSLGHLLLEAHPREPLLDVQWALGWLLVEAFAQRRPEPAEAGGAPAAVARAWRGALAAAKLAAWEERGEGAPEAERPAGLAARLGRLFAVLPRLPGGHGAPLLCLAVESVLASGLWRRADGHPRWARVLCWPRLFAFAHARLPADLRLRLWRAALQVCVAEPLVSSLAEVPHALAAVVGEAPQGSAELVQEAICLGASGEPLAHLCRALGGEPRLLPPGGLLLPAEGARAAELARRETLAELGVDVDAWAPLEAEAPDAVPPQRRGRLRHVAPRLLGAGLPLPAGAAKAEPAAGAEPQAPPERRSAVAEQRAGAAPTPLRQAAPPAAGGRPVVLGPPAKRLCLAA